MFQSGQWLLGNVASLGPFLPILTPPPSDPNESLSVSVLETTAGLGEGKPSQPARVFVSDSLLELFLRLCTVLLKRYHIPGVLQGKSGIVWTRSGASLTAAGVPRALHEQVGAPDARAAL